MKTKLTKSAITVAANPSVDVRIETAEEAAKYLGELLIVNSASRRTKPVFFDFGDEGKFEAKNGSKKFAQAMDDMAGALANGNARFLEIFRNCLGGVTVKAA